MWLSLSDEPKTFAVSGIVENAIRKAFRAIIDFVIALTKKHASGAGMICPTSIGKLGIGYDRLPATMDQRDPSARDLHALVNR